jgi:hypothetical protein
MGPSGFGANGVSAGSNGPNPFGQVNLYAFVQSSTRTVDNALTINGTSSITTSNLAGNYNVNSVRYVINSASYNTGSDICEILYYSRDVSVIERKAIEGYLMWKWGIKRQNEVGFTPTSISNCAVWYDADVNFNDATSRATSFTFSSGNLVNVWKDKSGNARDATFLDVSPSTTRPTLTANQVNGNCAVVFNGTNALESSYSLPTTQAHTLFVVAGPNANGFRSVISLNARPGTRGQQLNVYVSGSNTWWYSGGDAGTDGNTSSIAYVSNRYDILAFYWSTTLRTQMNINGHFIPSSTASPASLLTGSTMLIGSATSGSTPYELFSGGIAEIILYTAILTVDQRNQVERYLSLKWNRPLINACPIGHPNKLVPTFTRTFPPLDIGSCRLWLDAADVSTFTLSGTSITQWRDKSGFGDRTTGGTYNATGALGNNLGTVSITNANLRTANLINISGASPQSYVLVANTSDTTNNLVIIHWFTNPGAGTGNAFTGSMALRVKRDTVLADINQVGATISMAATQARTKIAIATHTGARMELFESGTVGPGTANTLSQTNGNLQIGIGTATAEIGEIIVFDKALTSGERQALEGYLAEKWGLRANLPRTHPMYTPLPTLLTTFNPYLISGCTLWLDGADSSTDSMTLSGSTLTEWKDKSGNIYTPGTAVNSPTLVTNALNGRTAVRFDSANSQYIDFGDANDMFNNQLCMFVVCSFTSTAGNGSIISKSIAGTAAGRYALIRESNVIIPLIERSGGVANNAGWTSTSTEVRVFTMQWNRSTLTLHHNGTSVYSTAFVDATTFSTTYKLLVGAYLNSSGTAPAAGFYFNGVIMEIIQYLAPVTTEQRLQVENYLSDKWGTHWASQVTTPVPFYVPPPSDLVSFNPSTSISGCRLWIDASDINSVNNGLVTGGSTVTSLADKSGTGATITTVGSPTWDGFLLNKLPGINTTSGRFTGVFSSEIPTFAHTCFIVTRLITNPSTGYPCFGIANSATSSTRYLRCLDWATTIRSVGFFGATVPVAVLTAPAVGTPFLWVSAFTGVNPLYAILNSGTAFNSSAIIAISPGANASHFAIGTEPFSGTNANTWPGVVSEIIVYDRVLTTVDRIRVERYLSQKWGLVQTILAANRVINLPPIPNTPRFFPSALDNLTLWLDATDPYATGVPPTSGTSLTRWIDKSSTRASFTTVNALPVYTESLINGLPGIDMTNASAFISNATQTLSSSLTLAMVVVVKSGIGAWAPFFTHGSRDLDLAFERNAAGTTLQFQSGNDNAGANLTYTTDQVALYLGTMTTGTSRFFSRFGGGTTNTATGTNTTTITVGLQTIRIGINDGGDTTKSFIGEVVYYNRVLSPIERQTLEGYLAWKWGIASSLPTTHPYYKVTP